MTWCKPKSSQSTVASEGAMPKLKLAAAVQLSKLPLSRSAALMMASPFASKFTVMVWATMVGAALSATVTTAEAVLALPHSSVTVKVTLLAPMFSQLNDAGDTEKVKSLAAEQLSELPSFTWLPVIVATPMASNATVMFFATAVGSVSSTMVTT